MCESAFNNHRQPITVTTGFSYVNPRGCRCGRIQVGFIGGGVVELRVPPLALEEVTQHHGTVPELTVFLTEPH